MFNENMTCYSLGYEGEWQIDEMNGYGNFYWSDGSSYKGLWKDERRHGNGTQIYPQNSSLVKYIGEWREDLRNGFGKVFWINGNTYEGQFQNGIINGKGTFIWADGSRYDGLFENEKLHSFGAYAFPKNDTLQRLLYVGGWKENQRQGNGKLVLMVSKKKVYGKVTKVQC